MARRRQPEVAYWETDDLAQHISLIKRQMDRSLSDAQTRQLALKIVGNKADGVLEDGTRYVTAWGEAYRLPSSAACAMKDDVCESNALWDFAVQNVRYVLDPDGYDLFATARYTLEASGGDCDDFVILLGALHRAVGFSGLAARVVSTDGAQWEHVYLLVGFPKSRPTRWVPLDPTVAGATPGWQYAHLKAVEDYRL